MKSLTKQGGSGKPGSLHAHRLGSNSSSSNNNKANRVGKEVLQLPCASVALQHTCASRRSLAPTKAGHTMAAPRRAEPSAATSLHGSLALHTQRLLRVALAAEAVALRMLPLPSLGTVPQPDRATFEPRALGALLRWCTCCRHPAYA